MTHGYLTSYQQKLRALVYELKNKPCADCDIQYPPYVMQFDHVRGEKKFELWQWMSKSIRLITEEAEKCEVVCANCHAERTYQRFAVAQMLAEDPELVGAGYTNYYKGGRLGNSYIANE